ncbi:MAG: hypothetical protein RRA15_13235 [bacterium]|nr:hypothetical protein [bacterium]MDT8367423.1 hypothetical protein [bacterium]
MEKYLWQAATLLAVLDPSGTVVQRFEYADRRMPVSMTYQGGVYYFGYDPATGKWTAKDPLRLSSGQAIDFAGGDLNLLCFALRNVWAVKLQ